MAGKGTYAAFQQTGRSEVGLKDTIQRDETNQFWYRREQREIDAAKREAEKASLDLFGKTLDKLKPEFTGIDSMDKGIAQGYRAAADFSKEMYDRLRGNPDDFEAQMALTTVGKYGDNLGAFTSRFKEHAGDFMTGLEEGKYDPNLNQGLYGFWDSIFNRNDFMMGVDKRGFSTMAVKDENGEVKFIKFEDVFNGKALPTPIKRFLSDSWAVAKAKQYGILEETMDSRGFKTDVYKGFDPMKTETLWRDIDEEFGTKVEDVSDSFKSYWVTTLKKDLKDLNQENFNDAKRELMDKVINTNNTTIEKKIDFSAQNYARQLDLTAQQMKDKLNKEDKADWSSGISMDTTATQDANGQEKWTPVVAEGPDGEALYTYSLPSIIKYGDDENAPYIVEKLYMNPETKEVYFDGYQKKGKNTTKGKVTGEDGIEKDVSLVKDEYWKWERTKLGPDDANTMARLVGEKLNDKNMLTQEDLVRYLSGLSNRKQTIDW